MCAWCALFIILSLATIFGASGQMGEYGRAFAMLNLSWFGYLGYVYLLFFLYPAYALYKDSTLTPKRLKIITATILLSLVVLVGQFLLFGEGKLGEILISKLLPIFGPIGVGIFVVLCLLGGAMLIAPKQVIWLYTRAKSAIVGIAKYLAHNFKEAYAYLAPLCMRGARRIYSSVSSKIAAFFYSPSIKEFDRKDSSGDGFGSKAFDSGALGGGVFDLGAGGAPSALDSRALDSRAAVDSGALDSRTFDSRGQNPLQHFAQNPVLQNPNPYVNNALDSSAPAFTPDIFAPSQKGAGANSANNIGAPAQNLANTLNALVPNASQEAEFDEKDVFVMYRDDDLESKQKHQDEEKYKKMVRLVDTKEEGELLKINPQEVFSRAKAREQEAMPYQEPLTPHYTKIVNPAISADSSGAAFGVDSSMGYSAHQSAESNAGFVANDANFAPQMDSGNFATHQAHAATQATQTTQATQPTFASAMPNAPESKLADSALLDSALLDSSLADSMLLDSQAPESSAPIAPKTMSTPNPSAQPAPITQSAQNPQATPSTDSAQPQQHQQILQPQQPQPPKPSPKASSVYEASRAQLNTLEKGALELPKDYNLPSTALLQNPGNQRPSFEDGEIDTKTQNLLSKLKVFKIDGDVVRFYPGPVVTTFEFRPAPNVKVSRIAGLSDDLAMALSARSIRIQAPIPGKDAVGIEVPNAETQTIYLREILESEVFKNTASPLALGLGKDIVGDPFVTDLKTLPHLLIAGTTGSGKSVGVNAMILSLLYRNSPDNLKLIMIDPKKVEFSLYEEIPHLLTPIITDSKKAIIALGNVAREMERRYEAMKEMKTKTIDNYNEKARKEGKEVMPFIVIIIDELADLMMTGGKEAEASIIRIAQMGRASGLHLIVATQRPSVDVVTGLIKTNLPAKIAFKVGSRMDSRVILDTEGAQNLLGRGDMLFSRGGGSGVLRLHAPWTSEEEIEKIVEFIRAQREVEYDSSFLADASLPRAISEEEIAQEGGALIDEAKKMMLLDGKTSISNLQRRLNIGYNKAASIVEELEAQGFLSAPNAKGNREIIG
ncbi:hypothetical protein BKN38_03410 [Helicobacter sp. CLO-3]|nr:hypothetical protein BA723_01935 [Helicobacter sp. CLO-3]OHU84198.1 hypothetical protein BKN38_03410 [Helicobacter sp. CLO-3]